MRTLSSELGSHADRLAGRPRVYIDANMPSGVVAYMRRRLGWDALFVVEHDDLRRAPDGKHYHMARQLGRTLITLDRDYLDDRQFPVSHSPGVIVLAAPGERALSRLLRRVHEEVFDRSDGDGTVPALPLKRRKLHIHVDWEGLD